MSLEKATQNWDLFRTAYRNIFEKRSQDKTAGDNETAPIDQAFFEAWLSSNKHHTKPLFILAYALNLVDDEKNVNLTGAEVITALVKRELVRIRKEEAASNYPPKTLEILLALTAISDGFTKEQLSSFAQEMELDEFELKSCETLTYWKSAETDNSGNIKPGKFLYAALACAEDIENATSMLGRLAYDAEHILACYLPLGSLQAYCLQDSERCSKINAGLNRVVIENNLLDLSIALKEKLSADVSDETTHAGLLTNLSNHLADAGRREEGLGAIERAVEIYEKLAATNFAAYGPDLAMSLSVKSDRLEELSDFQSAYELALRAAELIAPFANPDTRWQDLSDAIQADIERLENKRK